ncbi:lactoylglutathione lyase [Methylobacterium sp. WL18]|uniref:VOC family protein n=1 Tax=Methylobacterium sp. WL18 TaxID=2603897 RepID=UPI0011CC8B4A|nr:VOC family protein [Methylobacterium sp. WL18]TXN75923.1 lactoylglutathione lyase [Methylobacterium sp. WL18]
MAADESKFFASDRITDTDFVLSGLSFHHFAVATEDVQISSAYLIALGYDRACNAYDPLQGVNLELWHHDTLPDVELVWPSESKGPLSTILKKKGVGIYHLCYEVDDISDAIDAFYEKNLNVLQIVEPRPAVLFDGRLVAFYVVDGFGLIELLCRSRLSSSD